VGNGTCGHATVLPCNVSIRDALAAYAQALGIGDKQEVTVSYQMWLDSEIKVSGKHTFNVKH
jgi:hypothetical protein